PHDHRMRLTGQVHVVVEPALTAQEPLILEALDRLADPELTHQRAPPGREWPILPSRRARGHWGNLLRHTSLRAPWQPSTYTHVRLGLPRRSRLVWLATCP